MSRLASTPIVAVQCFDVVSTLKKCFDILDHCLLFFVFRPQIKLNQNNDASREQVGAGTLDINGPNGKLN